MIFFFFLFFLWNIWTSYELNFRWIKMLCTSLYLEQKNFSFKSFINNILLMKPRCVAVCGTAKVMIMEDWMEGRKVKEERKKEKN